MLKHKETYEIISPEDIGLFRSNESGIVLGKLRYAVCSIIFWIYSTMWWFDRLVSCLRFLIELLVSMSNNLLSLYIYSDYSGHISMRSSDSKVSLCLMCACDRFHWINEIWDWICALCICITSEIVLWEWGYIWHSHIIMV